uniref:Uncharacterized protein n=1 Tax=Helianthus annuus TaxID=4232 RepID=A0A251S890_HELAN
MKENKVGGAPSWLHQNPGCPAKIWTHFHTKSANLLCSEPLYVERKKFSSLTQMQRYTYRKKSSSPLQPTQTPQPYLLHHKSWTSVYFE